jgi:hypothetical protein
LSPGKRSWILLLTVLLLIVAEPGLGSETRWVDRFDSRTKTDTRGIPDGWSLKKYRGEFSKIGIVREDKESYLRLLSRKDAFGLKREMSFDIRRTPHLSWKWRVIQNLRGGDIRVRATDDQAGQIHVLFPRFPALTNTRAVGYIWDLKVPKGHSGVSPSYKGMKYFVLRSGEEKVGRWMTEVRNVYEDYRTLFQEEPPEVGGGLLFINSQLTQTGAECHYREIFFSETDSGLRGGS